MGADCVVVRHPASGAAHRLAGWIDRDRATPDHTAIVNAGDGTHEHPTQALLDAATLRDRLGGIAGRRIGDRRRRAAQPGGPVERVPADHAGRRGRAGGAADAAAGRGARSWPCRVGARPGRRAAGAGRGDDAAGAGRADARRRSSRRRGSTRSATGCPRRRAARCCPSTRSCCTPGRWCAAWRSRPRWPTRRASAILAQVRQRRARADGRALPPAGRSPGMSAARVTVLIIRAPGPTARATRSTCWSATA